MPGVDGEASITCPLYHGLVGSFISQPRLRRLDFRRSVRLSGDPANKPLCRIPLTPGQEKSARTGYASANLWQVTWRKQVKDSSPAIPIDFRNSPGCSGQINGLRKVRDGSNLALRTAGQMVIIPRSMGTRRPRCWIQLRAATVE